MSKLNRTTIFLTKNLFFGIKINHDRYLWVFTAFIILSFLYACNRKDEGKNKSNSIAFFEQLDSVNCLVLYVPYDSSFLLVRKNRLNTFFLVETKTIKYWQKIYDPNDFYYYLDKTKGIDFDSIATLIITGDSLKADDAGMSHTYFVDRKNKFISSTIINNGGMINYNVCRQFKNTALLYGGYSTYISLYPLDTLHIYQSVMSSKVINCN